jgi:hypothetical protein
MTFESFWKMIKIVNISQVNKLPFQRIVYRAYEATPTYSALDLFPHSPIMQEIYQNPTPFTNIITVSCEITIFHIYHKNLQQRIALVELSSTVSPNMLGWDGRRKNGDPDNSALHSTSNKLCTTHCMILLVNLVVLVICPLIANSLRLPVAI